VKRVFPVFLTAVAVILAGFFVFPAHAAEEQALSTRVIAYYFHGDLRCPTCHKLEQYSKEAIETNFKDETASGKLVFKEVNVDKKENEHYVNDYQLYTKALVLSFVRGDKEVASKNLSKIWELVGDKQKFSDYVRGEVLDFLKD